MKRYALFERGPADDILVSSARLLGDLSSDIEDIGHNEWLIRDCWRDRWILPDEYWTLMIEAHEPVTAKGRHNQ